MAHEENGKVSNTAHIQNLVVSAERAFFSREENGKEPEGPQRTVKVITRDAKPFRF